MKLPPFESFPILVADDLVLRQVQAQDIPYLLDISFYDGQAASSLEEATQMQHKIDLDYQNGNSIHWCIVGRNRNEPMGTVGYYRGFTDGSGELGCVLRPPFRGQGIMTKALELAALFGLQAMGLRQVGAITSRQNTAAIRLLQRAHFERGADLEGGDIAFQYVPPIPK